MAPLAHPRLVGIAGYLDTVRATLARLVDTAADERLARAPAPGAWSGAQILEHLGKVEGATAKMLEGVFARALDAGLAREDDDAPVIHALDRYASDEGVLRRLEAPERLRPSAEPDAAACWASLVAVRERTYRAYATVDGRALTRVSAPHPLLGPLNGYEWLLFLGKHEERHVGQLRRTIGDP